MGLKSKDIDVDFFGSLKGYPTFMQNVNFNSDFTGGDFILDENGVMADHGIRNELRTGWKGKGENRDFLIILEPSSDLHGYFTPTEKIESSGERNYGNCMEITYPIKLEKDVYTGGG